LGSPWHWLSNTFSKQKKEAESDEQAVRPKEAVQKMTNCNNRHVPSDPVRQWLDVTRSRDNGMRGEGK